MHQVAAIVQVIAGTLALLLVVVGYVRYAPRVRVALDEADKLAGTINDEIGQAVKILTKVNGLVGRVRGTIPSASETIASVSGSVGGIATTIAALVPTPRSSRAFAEAHRGRAPNLRGAAAHPRPRRRDVHEGYSFNVPELIPKMRTVELPVPTATPHMAHIDLP